MTLREHYAGLAMQAIISNTAYFIYGHQKPIWDETAECAIKYADTLIAHLKKTAMAEYMEASEEMDPAPEPTVTITLKQLRETWSETTKWLDYNPFDKFAERLGFPPEGK